MPCPFPEHHGGSGGGGTNWLAVLALVFAVALVAAPVAAAASALAHAIAVLVQVLAITAAVAAGLGLIAGATWGVLALRRRRAYQRAFEAQRAVLTAQVITPSWPDRPAVTQATPAPDTHPALEAPHQRGGDLHLHFHGVSPEEVPGIISQAGR